MGSPGLSGEGMEHAHACGREGANPNPTQGWDDRAFPLHSPRLIPNSTSTSNPNKTCPAHV